MRIDPTLLRPPGAERSANNSGNLIEKLGNTFSEMMDEVNQAQKAADLKIEEFATTGEKDIHGTMIATQKASISLRLLLQVRSKLTSAYQELMRTTL